MFCTSWCSSRVQSCTKTCYRLAISCDSFDPLAYLNTFSLFGSFHSTNSDLHIPFFPELSWFPSYLNLHLTLAFTLSHTSHSFMSDNHTKLRLLSLNVNSLRLLAKRRAVCKSLRETDADIISHSVPSDQNIWSSEWGGGGGVQLCTSTASQILEELLSSLKGPSILALLTKKLIKRADLWFLFSGSRKEIGHRQNYYGSQK